ncbi:hypothetical protein [Acinetobacter sp. WCHAc060033]|uniref:hypothetical protein n=1 Tax=Acinetobacter sp. WCHAc060033 TaxID=2518624 RepID=UPI0013EEA2C8|nr:hypothetical protein [Acinetobacter sp. WCHAc060033]
MGTLQVQYSNRSNLPDCDVGVVAKNIKSIVDGEVVHTGDDYRPLATKYSENQVV